MTLNQLDPSFADLLPRSDSRFNPAQRALEEGRLDEAEQAKLALETKQRARNKAREERGERWTPRFFEEAASGEGYVYKGGYWEARRDVSLKRCCASECLSISRADSLLLRPKGHL